MEREEQDVQGRRLLSAVERILAENGSLVAYSNECMRRAKAKKLGDEDATIASASAEVVKHYSNLSAIAGGATALPGLVPGFGSIVAIAGGALADMALVLKFEVEMALVLTHLHGFDILDEKERQVAFLLASVSTYDAKSGGNFLVDLAKVETVAFWTYGPREVSKLLALVLARLALVQAGKSLVRAVPFVGIAVGSSMNKVLSGRVGERCTKELAKRRKMALEDKSRKPASDVVDAKVAS